MTLEPVYFLLVDDLEENLLALSALLRRDGLELLRARSATEALELLLKYDVALALVDVQMPHTNGFELAELMRGTERTRRIPIIFVTAGSGDYQRRFRGYEAGAVDFILKPIEPEVLRSKADVFFELYRQRQEVALQRDELDIATKENERLLLESRQQSEILRIADQRKDEFLAMLAHELRNPLAPIVNSLRVVTAEPADSESARTALRIMERQVKQLVRLVDDLLDVNRISQGKIELRHEQVDFKSIVEQAVESCQPLIEATRNRFNTVLPDSPISLYADSNRLAQVFSNLINNACKYTPAGGTITLAAETNGDELIVSVKDTGVGIPPAKLADIFSMFTQLDSSIERSQGGLGIGLTLVQRLVELHGGTVCAFSDWPNGGSEFVVRLPMAVPTRKGPQSDPSNGTTSNSTSRRILVVDDNLDSANSLAMLLKLSGHETRTAVDGVEAVAAAAEFSPELVLLDIGLPKLNGYEVARHIRGQTWGQKMHLVALTGWGQDEDRKNTHDAGFDAHLVKPVDLDALRTLLTELP